MVKSASPNNKDACVNGFGMQLHTGSCLFGLWHIYGSCHRLEPKLQTVLCQNIPLCSLCSDGLYSHPISAMLEASLPSQLRALLSVAITRHHTRHPVDKAPMCDGHNKCSILAGAVQLTHEQQDKMSNSQCRQLLVNDLQQFCDVGSICLQTLALLVSSHVTVTCRVPESEVLGQNQDCYGGCFDPQTSFDGDLADVRIWDQVLFQVPLQLLLCITSLHTLQTDAVAPKQSKLMCPVFHVNCTVTVVNILRLITTQSRLACTSQQVASRNKRSYMTCVSPRA